MAASLAELLGQKYGTTKQLARGVGIDVTTAENLRKGHLSITTLEKVLAAEGRALAERLLEELYGESFIQFEERRIEAALREVEGVRSNLVRIRAKGEELLARALSLDQAAPRTVARQERGGESRTWAGSDGSGNPGTRGSRDRGGR